VAPNDTPEGRQKNRRIEIMLIDKSLAGEMSKPAN
jgi:flagellar motor protein MotB